MLNRDISANRQFQKMVEDVWPGHEGDLTFTRVQAEGNPEDASRISICLDNIVAETENNDPWDKTWLANFFVENGKATMISRDGVDIGFVMMDYIASWNTPGTISANLDFIYIGHQYRGQGYSSDISKYISDVSIRVMEALDKVDRTGHMGINISMECVTPEGSRFHDTLIRQIQEDMSRRHPLASFEDYSDMSNLDDVSAEPIMEKQKSFSGPGL